MRDDYWMHRREMEEEVKEEEVEEKYVIVTCENYGGFAFDLKACNIKKPQHIFGVEQPDGYYNLYSIRTGKQICPGDPNGENWDFTHSWCFYAHEVKEISLEKLNKKLAKRGLPPWK
jgi:hypothetical protein